MPRKESDYSKTVMYKIVCNDLNVKYTYVGHTTTFIKRKWHHKSSTLTGTTKLYRIIRENGGWENWTMLQIEEYPCDTLLEARLRERYWYELLNADLNEVCPQRTKQESDKIYQTNNKSQIREQRKQYRENNKEIIKERKRKFHYANQDKLLEKAKQYRENNKESVAKTKREWYEKHKEQRHMKNRENAFCECGITIRKSSLCGHIKTSAHINAMDDSNKFVRINNIISKGLELIKCIDEKINVNNK